MYVDRVQAVGASGRAGATVNELEHAPSTVSILAMMAGIRSTGMNSISATTSRMSPPPRPRNRATGSHATPADRSTTDRACHSSIPTAAAASRENGEALVLDMLHDNGRAQGGGARCRRVVNVTAWPQQLSNTSDRDRTSAPARDRQVCFHATL